MKSLKIGAKKSGGFTLIEFIIVVALIGVGIVTVLNLYGGAKVTSQVNSEIQNLQVATSKIRGLFSSRGGNYAGLNDTMAIAVKAVPQSMIAGPSSIRNSFGGTVKFLAVGTSSFDVIYDSVPTAVCMELVPSVEGIFRTININGTNVKASNVQTDWILLTAQCTSSEATTIIFNAQ